MSANHYISLGLLLASLLNHTWTQLQFTTKKNHFKMTSKCVLINL